MVGGFLSFLRKKKAEIISGLAGVQDVVLEEAGFYDVGYMQSQIARLQKQIREISKELESSISMREKEEQVRQYQNNLVRRRESLIFYMIFYLSNSFLNLENCFKLAEGYQFEFMNCVKGLDEYNKGNKQQAYVALKTFIDENGIVEEHFLVNKVYGLLLYEAGNMDQAISFLTYAQRFMPDDEECLKALKDCYQRTRQNTKARVLEDVLAVLG